jgi:hypothetical protein
MLQCKNWLRSWFLVACDNAENAFEMGHLGHQQLQQKQERQQQEERHMKSANIQFGKDQFV